MTQETSLTDHQKNCAAAHHFFLRAAERLVEKMKSPAAFLLFLTDALNWLHMYTVKQQKYSRDEDNHYTLIVMVENIIVPWFAGGPDVISNIAKGIGEVYQFCGDDGMRGVNNDVIVGFGNYAEGMDFTSTGLREYSIAQSVLVDLLDALEAYDLAIHPKEQNETTDTPSIKDWLLSLGATPSSAQVQLDELRKEMVTLQAENALLKKKSGKLIEKEQLAMAS